DRPESGRAAGNAEDQIADFRFQRQPRFIHAAIYSHLPNLTALKAAEPRGTQRISDCRFQISKAATIYSRPHLFTPSQPVRPESGGAAGSRSELSARSGFEGGSLKNTLPIQVARSTWIGNERSLTISTGC